jgi:hypothetical protein
LLTELKRKEKHPTVAEWCRNIHIPVFEGNWGNKK